MKIAIVGAFSGTHMGGNFARAAERLGIETLRIDTAGAWGNSRLARALSWRLGDRKPPRMEAFAANLIAACGSFRPDVLVATGNGFLSEPTLRALGDMGIRRLNYSTDDPWNPAHLARWHMRALPAYDVVFTTRRANMEDFRRLGCRDVRYLPFAYDDELIVRPADIGAISAPDVLFVGNADRDRFEFMKEFVTAGGIRPALVGDYWARYDEMRPQALGLKRPQELCALTAAAKVNLCLVRRANRDGHVMRSFEIAAIGGCMLAEDTVEHREIFGPDDECVVYFQSGTEASAKAGELLADSTRRARLAFAVRRRMENGRHTYVDRFRVIAESAVANANVFGELCES